MVLSMSSRRKLITTTSVITSSNSNSNSSSNNKTGRKLPTTVQQNVNKLTTSNGGSASSINNTHHEKNKFSSSNNNHRQLNGVRSSNKSSAMASSSISSSSSANAKSNRSSSANDAVSSAAARQEQLHQQHLSNTYVQSSSQEDMQAYEELYEQRLGELKAQLSCLRKLKLLAPMHADQKLIEKYLSLAKKYESGCGIYNYVEHYVNESIRKDKEASENLFILKAWFDKQKIELEQAYANEHAKATLELQDRQRELKENLLNEYEEKRRQVEADKTGLDINTDVTEVKPPPTRKLRRRQNADTDAPDATSSTITTGGCSASILLSNSIIVSGCSSISTASGVGGSASGATVVNASSVLSAGVGLTQYSSSSLVNTFSNNYYGAGPAGVGNYYSTALGNSIFNSTSGINDRKRKLSPAAITFSLNDDEIGEDYKYLLRNLNNNTNHNFK